MRLLAMQLFVGRSSALKHCQIDLCICLNLLQGLASVPQDKRGVVSSGAVVALIFSSE